LKLAALGSTKQKVYGNLPVLQAANFIMASNDSWYMKKGSF
jgi:hypothetical protein